MDFMKYADRPSPLMQDTIDTLVDAYNLTPANFENPPDATIERVVAQVCKQMKEDKTYLPSASPLEDSFFSESTNETDSAPAINAFKTEDSPSISTE